MRGSVRLCDIYARIPTERKSTFTSKHMLSFLQRLTMKDTHFVSLTMNPESRHRTADVGKIGEKLRLSPYCCCYLPPQCEQFPCIIDDSQQNVRECRQVRFVKS
ncbi:LOW QUALITY PROTEIN: transmembrane protease serine 11D [Scomber scombrus]|uniref:LOW QUALITY PROTEIN: transmembrane protease serine 11D n=1 Tax=Scomber scombrus TaxID=13677 RepID=A0AAV1MXF4_SCOSC